MHQELGCWRCPSRGCLDEEPEEREATKHSPQLGPALGGRDSGSAKKAYRVFMAEGCKAGDGSPEPAEL